MPDGTAEEVCVQNIGSALLFCKDSTCVDTSTDPYRDLYLNSKFWIVHRITDDRFSDKKLLLRELTMAATTTKLTLTPLEKREEDG
jgi:hypothetical protein